ncbi:MAG TPA: hypothetical protein VGJ84_17270, partial [Polyangiaceae bacterium]
MKITNKGKGGRPRNGHLELRGKNWWAQLTVTVDGESVRKWFNLNTDSKPVARRKMARLIKELANGGTPLELTEQAKRAEYFGEACERVHQQRVTDGVKVAKDEIARLRAYAMPDFGQIEVTKIASKHINAIYD